MLEQLEKMPSDTITYLHKLKRRPLEQLWLADPDLLKSERRVRGGILGSRRQNRQ
jgi:hypothetical protein